MCEEAKLVNESSCPLGQTVQSVGKRKRGVVVVMEARGFFWMTFSWGGWVSVGVHGECGCAWMGWVCVDGLTEMFAT